MLTLQNKLAQAREDRANGEGGFTLIELLVVVVIIGILIAIAIPLYLNYKKGANDKAAQSDLRNAIATLETCNADNSSYPSAMTFTGNTTGSSGLTGCSAQTVNKTSATTLNYVVNSAGTAYALQSYSSSGNTSSASYYCYSSSKGGSVVQSTATFATAANVATFSC